MNWVENISEAIKYIEDNIMKDISVQDISNYIGVSPFYFQKGFSFLAGIGVAEYIRKRRLSLAGSEIINSNAKIIDIAMKYGYDSPDSFTKAFTRFHGSTPSQVREQGAMIKSYMPMKINLTLVGGDTIDYKIEEKDEFKVIGISKVIKYENAFTDAPKLWGEFFRTGKNKKICGKYGINNDKEMKGNEFEYMIADDYVPDKELPDGFITKVIPKHTWAIFTCIGDTSKTIAEINKKIFSEWLPNSKNYEIAEGYFIEMYSDPTKYKKGVRDKEYYTEVWIPVNIK